MVYSQNYQVMLKLVEQAGFSNLNEFSLKSDIPMAEIFRVVYGLLAKTNVEILLKLSQFLKVPINELILLFSTQGEISPIFREELEGEVNSQKVLEQEKEEALIKYQNVHQQLEKNAERFSLDIELVQASFRAEKENLKQEYLELQAQVQQEKELAKEELQDATLDTLESLLIQLPTVTAAIQENPEFSSVKLLPLFKPLMQLLQNWGIEVIGSVGAEVPYEPQYHQLLEDGIQYLQLVKVEYVGYKQGLRVLYRAKVSPVW